MKSKQRIIISVVLTVIFIFGVTSTQAREGDLISSLNLNKEQVEKLSVLIEQFNSKALEVKSRLDDNYLKLGQDLQKKDRFDTKSKARAGAQNVNKLLKNISSLYGDLMKLRVEYLLKAKDILTERQKVVLLTELLDFEMDMPENVSNHLDLDLSTLGLDLTRDQIKKILKYRAKRDIKGINLKLKTNYKLLDLQDEILAEVRDTKKINKIIMDITGINTEIINNRVNHTLKAKDVLTVDQKKELLHMLLMMSGY
jgi:Spy/CpxP family protein refolding chaperone